MKEVERKTIIKKANKNITKRKRKQVTKTKEKTKIKEQRIEKELITKEKRKD